MILSGILRRIGDSTTNLSSGAASIDSLEVGDHKELRNLRGTRYIVGHLVDAVGEDVVVGLSGTTVIALKKGGKTYKDLGFVSILQANVFKLLLTIFIVGPFFACSIGSGRQPSLFGWMLPSLLLLGYSRYQFGRIANSVEEAPNTPKPTDEAIRSAP